MAGGDDLELGVGRVLDAKAAQNAAPAEGVGAAPPSRATDASSSVEELTQALAAGEIDPAGAQEMLIDAVVQEQLPADASPELIEAIRAEVEAMLAEDPTLQAMLQP